MKYGIFDFKCPNCGNLFSHPDLISGNTFGRKLKIKIFSDGRNFVPGLNSAFPTLTKCNKCKTIFWYSKAKDIKTYDFFDVYKNKVKLPKADYPPSLDMDDYFNALEDGIAENLEEELFIRQNIWWRYNNRIISETKRGIEIFDNKSDELRWIENLKKLKTLLNPSNLDEKIMIAEIHRNLGDFENCIRIIRSIDDENRNWIKEKYLYECKRKNRWVIELN